MSKGWFEESERHREAAAKGLRTRGTPIVPVERVDRQRMMPGGGGHWIWVGGKRYALISGPSLKSYNFQELLNHFERGEPEGTAFRREGLIVKTKEGLALYGRWIRIKRWVKGRWAPV